MTSLGPFFYPVKSCLPCTACAVTLGRFVVRSCEEFLAIPIRRTHAIHPPYCLPYKRLTSISKILDYLSRVLRPTTVTSPGWTTNCSAGAGAEAPWRGGSRFGGTQGGLGWIQRVEVVVKAVSKQCRNFRKQSQPTTPKTSSRGGARAGICSRRGWSASRVVRLSRNRTDMKQRRKDRNDVPSCSVR